MKTLGRKLFFVLIGSGFLGFGVYVLTQTAVPVLVDWHQMKSWEPVPATLISVQGSRNHTQAEYHYSVGGFSHTGTRVCLAFILAGAGIILFDMVMAIIALPFALLALICNFAAIHLLFYNLRVTLTGQVVNLRHRLFLFPVWYRSVAFDQVSALTVKRTGSTGQGTRKVEHYKLLAQTRAGKAVTLAREY